ncbi:glycoside hydrolase family 18 protein [Roseixanthobacter glucoisosaccharinicivorans]|uniref:glycoside hydrolase family 18 protein n=1 Tax=Roseixanthobacter glucoisosaccharinicivorans TaxID=3119923 RepID=UPI00372C11E5
MSSGNTETVTSAPADDEWDAEAQRQQGDPGIVTALTWAWGTNTVLDFDPTCDTLDFGWFTADTFTVAEVAGSVVISIPSSAETYTLRDVTLAELSLANISALNASALVAWSRILDPGDGAFGGNAGLGTEVDINWGWATHETIAFDPAHDLLNFGWIGAANFTLSEVDGSTVIALPASDQTYTLAGVGLAELSLSNITADDVSALTAWSTALSAAHAAQDDTGGASGTQAPAELPAEPVPATPQEAQIPVVEVPVVETPVVETPVVETPVTEMPVSQTPVAEVPPTETSSGSTPVDTPASAAKGPILAGYYADWTVYDHNYTISDVPADQLTNLIYASANIDANGHMVLVDPYSDTQMLFSAADSVDGIADTAGQGLAGSFNQIVELKAEHPDLKVSMMIGGWTLSANFSDTAATAEGRDTFAQSVVDFLKTYPMFDGVDLDWEFPGGEGAAGNSVRPDDGANYALLVADLRHALDGLEAETGRDYTISVASPVGATKIANFNLAGLDPYVDWFNVMAYDFHGTWETTTGHLAPLVDSADGTGIESAVAQYLVQGIDPGKMVLGAPLYTAAWSGVADGGDGGLDAASTGFPVGSSVGHYDYADILAKLEDPSSGWSLYWDDNAQAAYVYNAQLGIFSSVETPASVAMKAEWAQSQGLGGMMFYDLSGDATGSAESLVKAAYESWVQGKSFADIVSASSLTPDHIIGGNGVLDSVVSAAPVAHAPETIDITWNWGKQEVITDFQPSTDVLNFGWVPADSVVLSEVNGSTVIALPENLRTYTLKGVALDQLSLANVTGYDSSIIDEWAATLDAAHKAADAQATLLGATTDTHVAIG